MIDPLSAASSFRSRPVQDPTAGLAASAGAAFQRVAEAQNRANLAQEQLVSGQRSDVEGVLIDTQKADMDFRLLLAVRNKLVEAYQELQQVRV